MVCSLPPCLWQIFSFVFGAKKKNSPMTVEVTEAKGKANGETILFIHGWPDSAQLWEKQVDDVT